MSYIKIPDSVVTIGFGAFSGCDNIVQGNIPERFKELYFEIFARNDLEEKINYKGIEEYSYEINDKTIQYLQGVINYGLEKEHSNLTALVEKTSEKNKQNLLDLMKSLKEEFVFDDNSKEKMIQMTEKLDLWITKDFIPFKKLYDKIEKKRQVEIFDSKQWEEMLEKSIFKKSEENQVALAGMSYAFGLFEKDKYEVNGKVKTQEELNADEISISSEERTKEVMRLAEEGKFTDENLEILFNDAVMEFDAAFYRFFMDNEEEIFTNKELMKEVSKIQKNMAEIMDLFDGEVPTIEQCDMYFSLIEDAKTQEDNELLELCEYTGMIQEEFEKYKKLYEKQILRDKINSKSLDERACYKLANITSPDSMLLGNGDIKDSLSRFYQSNVTNLQDATLEGKKIEIYGNDGTLIAESLLWKNNEVIYLDSIELKNIERLSKDEQIKIREIVTQVYKQMLSELIEVNEKQIEEFKNRKKQEIMQMDISMEEKENMLKALEKFCEDSKLKRVMANEHDDITLKKIIENNPLAKKIEKSKDKKENGISTVDM